MRNESNKDTEFDGIYSLRAATAKTYNSIEDIKRDIGNINKLDDIEYSKRLRECDVNLDGLIEEILKKKISIIILFVL